MAKSKVFERAAQSIFDLFQDLYNRNALTVGEATQFNEAYEVVILHYNESIAPAPCPLPWTDEEFAEAWAQWVKYKREQHNFSYKPTGIKATLDGLYKDANGDARYAIEIIEFSMKNGYKGLFAPKGGIATNTPKLKASAANLINANQGAASMLGL